MTARIDFAQVAPPAAGAAAGLKQDVRSSVMLTFAALVFALSVPFWVVGAVTGGTLSPGLP